MKKLIIILSIFLFFNAQAAEISQKDIQRYSAYYSNGIQYLKNQQYSSAIIEFKKVLRFSPYDATTLDALCNSYYARANYYRHTTKEVKRALKDYKSAYFYAKYWKNNASTSNSIMTLAQNAKSEIENLEKRLQTTTTEDLRYQEAKVLKAQGELAAAGYDFHELKNGKYKIQAYENLGNIYKNLNNLSMGMDFMKEAIDLNPKNAKLHFLYGVMLDEAKNYEASIEQYNLALEYGENSPELLEILENKWTQNIVNNPRDAQSYNNLGAIYQKQGNLEAARTQYLKATQMDSSDTVGFYNLASLYIAQKNYEAAVNVYDKLLINNPNNLEVLEYKASILKEMGRYDDSLKQYEKILALNPDNSNAKNEIEDITMNHFSGEKLQSYLISKAQNLPKSYEAQFNCALELHKNKKYAQAIEYYKKAQNLDASKSETYLNLAQIYIEQKNYAEASSICQKGLLVLPNDNQLSSYLNDIKNYETSSIFDNATQLFDQKRYSEAITLYKKIPNQNIDVKMAIASCYWNLNDYKNANKYYQEVLSIDSNNIEALTNSAYAYYSLNDFTNAKNMASKALSIDKTNESALDIVSSIEQTESSSQLQKVIDEYEKGNFQTSLDNANKILSKKSDNEYALYYKGLCQDELKKPQEAQKTYKLLISKHPEFSEAYYSLAVNLDNNSNYKDAISNYEKFLSLKGNEKDEMTEFSTARIKELKDYLNQLNGK